MGIEQVIKGLYIDLPSTTFRRATVVGQFCWIVAPYLEREPWIYDAGRADPTEHTVVKGEIRVIQAKDFRPKDRLPIKGLGLREADELLVLRAKRRLGVVLASDYTIFDDITVLLRQRGQSHLQESSVIVAPLYGVEGTDHHGGFPPLMVARIQALQYRQFFHCPLHSVVYEGVLRLDRLLPVFPLRRSLEPTQIALHPEALGIVLTMVRALFGAPPDETFIALQEILKETLPA